MEIENVTHAATVLVVDDEALVRLLVIEVLQDLGCKAIEAGDGPSGLRVLNSPAHIDLLVTDIGLPGGVNGHALADAARELRPGLRVLFLTGHPGLDDGKLAAGMTRLTKPFGLEALTSHIRDLLAIA